MLVDKDKHDQLITLGIFSAILKNRVPPTCIQSYVGTSSQPNGKPPIKGGILTTAPDKTHMSSPSGRIFTNCCHRRGS